MNEYAEVRVWPLAERTRSPEVHLIERAEAVTGKTLCGQPARNAMQETPPSDLTGLRRCETCDEIAAARS